MSRKILSLIVAIAFVLTTMGTAFAAPLPSDVTADFSKAVSKVQALNIMIGDAGTGLFRPTDTIKRSEFAVIAVKAMGLNDSAIISKGATKFSDVAADHWASGYINVAVGAGLINGYPDGTYKPDNTINYAEAITILANMLGYGPVLAGKPWPGAYVAQANASGVTSGVVMAPTVGASRGNVAKLVSNTLDSKMVTIKEYDINGKPTYTVGTTDADTLMSKKLSIDPVVDNTTNNNKTFFVTKTPQVMNSPTVDDSTLNNTDSNINITKGFVDGLNPNDYLGLDVKFWKNSDGKVVTAEVQTSTSDIYVGKVENDGGKLKLTDKGISYAQASTYVGYMNSTAASVATIASAVSSPNKGVGLVVIRDGGIRFANIYVAGDIATVGQINKTFTVKEVSDGYIKARGNAVTDIKVQDIKDNATKKAVRYDIVKDGKAATIDDIKAGDVVQRVGDNSSNSLLKYERWIVTSTEVKGTLTAVSGTGNDMTVTIGGKDYNVATYLTTKTWSFNNGDDWNKDYTNVKDIVGKDVTVKLNAQGNIASLLATSGSTTYYYGVVRSFAANVGANLDNAVTLYKADGTKVSYIFDKLADATSISSTGGYATVKYSTAPASDIIRTGDLVQYQLTSDGKISEATLRKATDLTTGLGTDGDGKGYAETVAAAAIHDSYITLSGDSGVITSATAIFNINPLMTTADDAQKIGFSAIDKTRGDYTVIINGGLVKAIVVNNPNAAAGTSGVVVGTGIDADGTTVTINVAGTVKTYKAGTISAGELAYLKAGTFVNYNVGSDGKINHYVTDFSTVKFATENNLSTFQAVDVHIYRIMSIDTANKVIKVEHINPFTKMATGSDFYFRYDTANLDVYNVKGKGDSPVNIIGGKSISDVSANDYVWMGGSEGSAYDFSKLLVLKVDDLVN